MMAAELSSHSGSQPSRDAPRCAICGYQVVGQGVGGRCPECGIALAPQSLMAPRDPMPRLAHSLLPVLIPSLAIAALPLVGAWRSGAQGAALAILHLPMLAVSAAGILAWGLARRRTRGAAVAAIMFSGLCLGLSAGAGLVQVAVGSFPSTGPSFTATSAWGWVLSAGLLQLTIGLPLATMFGGYAWLRVPRLGWPS